MTVGELMHGRGTPMSAHELAVVWPLYDAACARIAERNERERDVPRKGRRR